MSNTKYQVFISSTYVDLIEERRAVMESILKMDCIPAGMELFPAANDEQFEFIKRVIDDCDYYVIILGGRYGSSGSDGIGYTEKEFDYALSKGIPVVSFIHEDPGSIPVKKSDLDPATVSKMAEFRNKVRTGRLVNFWSNKDDLGAKVVIGLIHAIKTNKRPGWNRGGSRSNEELLQEIDSLRTENGKVIGEYSSLAEKLKTLETREVIGIAGGDDLFHVKGTYTVSYRGGSYDKEWAGDISWNEILYHLHPILLEWNSDSIVRAHLTRTFSSKFDSSSQGSLSKHMDEDVFFTIRNQLMALKLVDVQSLSTTKGGTALFWKTTQQGSRLGSELRLIKK